MSEPETIAAIATAPGRGGIAVVRVSGPRAHAVAAAVSGMDENRVRSLAGRFVRAHFRSAAGILDDGLMLVFAAPASYTGEDAVEFQGHGGTRAPQTVLEACLAAGARVARKGEFTLRAFLNGKLSLPQAEAVIDLVDARTDRAAADAARRLAGASRRIYDALYSRAVALAADAEHFLDFDEDDSLPPDFLPSLASRAEDLLKALVRQIATSREGLLLRRGALVVLAGEPNVGKSSLLNALLGENRAIVAPVPGTTRDSVTEETEMGGYLVRLADTAGMRATDDPVEAEGVARARSLAAGADVVVALSPGAAAEFPGAIEIRPKADLVPPEERGPGLWVSSATGEGLRDLRAAVVRRLDGLAAGGAEGDGADCTIRERDFLERAAARMREAGDALAAGEAVLAANALSNAAAALGELLGRVWHEDVLDALFSRFCVGK